MDRKQLTRSLISGDPAALLSWISGVEFESEVGRRCSRWAEAPSRCESAHIYRHGLVHLKMHEISSLEIVP